MKFFGLVLLMMVLVVVLAHIASVVNRANGIPDFVGQFLPGYEDQRAEDRLITETLQAPFADADVSTAPSPIGVEYTPYEAEESAVALNLPHRNSGDIMNWVAEAASTTLTFYPREFETHLEENVAPYMTPSALREFQTYIIEQRSILGYMRTNRLQLRTVVDGIPEIIQSGSVDGRFRWLVRVPVNLTFLPETVRTYTDEGTEPEAFQLLLELQLGRDNEAAHDGIRIEIWGDRPR